ncbi:P-loop containing nucleoside triphosphate hydrolase protein [Apiospora phragmitis]|uniref:ATP-dependent RNA helicase n=1 Tax=Apiospora phragmitis TaxID=2905665 RepID=A0ABR1X6T3_9PEZI
MPPPTNGAARPQKSQKSHKAKQGSKTESKPMSKTESKTLKRKRDQESLAALQLRVDELDPKTADYDKFSALPLSSETARGLDASHFENLTDIQKKAIPLALKGLDVLGAAKTGSGKTLAFLTPVLEKLYRAQWTSLDGLGALIISPTRELAVQIFEVLRKIGRYHSFSAGLVIGGKNLKEEAERLERMNILVCTPGRMLQHLDQTAGLDVTNLQILVLDEADRTLDMGFQSALDALVEHLPKERQTLLFSATQSKRVSDLARLSLKDPEYISVHESAASATPVGLSQHYLVVPLPEKLNTLWGFIRSNVKTKTIVFASSGKQVRFIYESFRHMQPGIPLLHLHGKQKQLARMEINRRFLRAEHSCLITTDVCARGVDFPSVDWVVQVDAPEDVDTYIHRVGRTARNEKLGKAVLFLDPSEEEGMLQRFESKRIPIVKITVKENKKTSVAAKIQDQVFHSTELKYLAQKAFISYTRSISLQKDKNVFDLRALDLEGFSRSLGLPQMPQVKMPRPEDVRKLKNRSRAEMSSGSEDELEGSAAKPKNKQEVRTKYDKMFERQNQDVLSVHYQNLRPEEASDDEFFPVKRQLGDDDLDAAAPKNSDGVRGKVITVHGGQELVIDSKRREKLIQSKKKMLKYQGKGTKTVFDDEGQAHSLYELGDYDDFAQAGPAEAQRRRFVEEEKDKVREVDDDDKAAAKARRQEKKMKRKERERAELAGEEPSKGDKRAQIGTSEDAQDALDFLRSLPVAGGDGDGGDGDDDAEPPKKKAKKWFQDESEDEAEVTRKKKRGKVIEVAEMPDTLEDYEALAAGLLDD